MIAANTVVYTSEDATLVILIAYFSFSKCHRLVSETPLMKFSKYGLLLLHSFIVGSLFIIAMALAF